MKCDDCLNESPAIEWENNFGFCPNCDKVNNEYKEFILNKLKSVGFKLLIEESLSNELILQDESGCEIKILTDLEVY